MMRPGFLPLGVMLAAFAALPVAAEQAAPVAAQSEAAGKIWPSAAEQVSYAALQSLPDWRGIWLPMPGAPKPEIPRLIGKYKTLYDEIQALIKSGDPEAQLKVERRASACEPPGMPGVMTQPYDIEFLFTPGRVTMIQEAYMQVRRIFTDGRPLPEDPDPTYNGFSVGHWEGSTLVVTTVGLREGGIMGRWGISHSDKVKITERIHLDPANKDVLVVENTFEDPLALAAPWHSTYLFSRERAQDQLEFICAQNDRNPISDKGEVGFIDAAH
ncbi:hypothetical protein [Sphingobium nicotianae]|uniref:Uncharacterized protein n=1 Tax=Sphingobium nicotianae TaxID=2782607 RepID=A0A9X1DA17_9SPHN|nr:hypothetical protein [Sphingobium nicotianae]MBT2186144.1 hypothetical protein [Sphingobium nicotianae]